MPNIFETADQFRRALLARERASASRMVEAYGASWVRIRERLAEIGEMMAETRRRGGTVSVFWLHEADRLNGVLDLTRAEFSRFSQFAERQIVEQQRAAVQSAGGQVEQLTLEGLGPAPPGAFISLTRLDTLATETMVGILGDGSPLKRLLGQLPAAAAAVVSTELVTGVATGASITNIARRIRHGLGGNMVRALTIARTEVLRAQREASRLTMMENEHVLDGWIWHSNLSKNTCAACFPAGVVVSGPIPEKVFSRHYSGDVVVIETASGEHLTVTPNHPILTPNGWVEAGMLNVGFDVIRSAGRDDAPLEIGVNNDYMPTSIEQVAESLGMVPAEVECSPPDFHGDGVGSEVYVVWTDSLLGNNLKSAICEEPQQFEFPLGPLRPGSLTSAPLPVLCSSNAPLPGPLVRARVVAEDDFTRLQGGACTPQGITLADRAPRRASSAERCCDCAPRHIELSSQSEFSLPRLILRRDFSIREVHEGVAARAILRARDGVSLSLGPEQSAFHQYGGQPLPADAESGRDLLRTLSGHIRADRILKIGFRCFSGQVYNLQTGPGWYFANGIIAHNCYAMHGTVHKVDERLDGHPRCKCIRVPQTKTWADLGFPGAPETRANVPKGVDLFEKLPEEDQDAILGRAAGLAYRAGAVKLPDFVGRKRSPRWGTMRYARSLKSILGSGAAPWVSTSRASSPPTSYPPGMRPVSTALKVSPGRHRRAVNHAAQAIDAIHIDGDLPETIVRTSSRLPSETDGRFRTYPGNAPPTIDINKISVSPELTAAHEIGHLLDVGAFGIHGYPATLLQTAELHGWERATWNSEALINLRRMAHPVRLPDGSMVLLDQQHLAYLLDPMEIWARSYAQYIATRTKSVNLKGQLEDLLAAQASGPIEVYEQWHEADFVPIANEFDMLFRNRGWLLP